MELRRCPLWLWGGIPGLDGMPPCSRPNERSAVPATTIAYSVSPLLAAASRRLSASSPCHWSLTLVLPLPAIGLLLRGHAVVDAAAGAVHRRANDTQGAALPHQPIGGLHVRAVGEVDAVRRPPGLAAVVAALAGRVGLHGAGDAQRPVLDRK